jgi:hypothetical protein
MVAVVRAVVLADKMPVPREASQPHYPHFGSPAPTTYG